MLPQHPVIEIQPLLDEALTDTDTDAALAQSPPQDGEGARERFVRVRDGRTARRERVEQDTAALLVLIFGLAGWWGARRRWRRAPAEASTTLPPPAF